MAAGARHRLIHDLAYRRASRETLPDGRFGPEGTDAQQEFVRAGSVDQQIVITDAGAAAMSGAMAQHAAGSRSAAAATSTDAVAPGKSHYIVLDGLRGVAALMVVMFHTFEAYSGGDPTRQIINHGYLAVDFFFLLSGFVIAYAYDDRWGRMRPGEFYRRRLIRLQPMVVLGSVFGAALFYFQAGGLFPKIAATPVWQLLLVMLLGCTLLPLPKPYDIRGWDEIHPLNGPAWSLFYEYVANLAYALVLRHLSSRVLTVLAVLAAALLLEVAVLGERRDLVGG